MKQTKFYAQITSYVVQAFFLFIASFSLVNVAFAVDLANVSASTMITNFAASIPDLMRLVTAIAYVLGIYMVTSGVLQLKKYGEQKTQMSSESSLKGPLITIAVGASLLYLPTSVQQGFSTFWTNPSPYAYQTSESGPFKEFIDACFLIVQLIGTIYFIKGLTMMTHLNANSQQGFSRALTHIIGGIFCIDLYDFLNMIFVTLGLGEM
jgi:intracellular multiplication protein IcmC